MPIDPQVAGRIKPSRAEREEILSQCATYPDHMADAYLEYVFVLRRLALDPDIDNVHHARNYAKKALTRMGDWRQQDSQMWKMTWRNDRG